MNSRAIQLALVASASLLVAGPALAQSANPKDAPALTVFTWAGYDKPDFRQPFIEKYGKDKVNYAFFSSTNDAYAKLKGGFKADVAHPCIHDVKKWKEAGLIQPIDTSKLKYWNDLIPALRNAKALQFEGKQWMVPWEWGASSVIYRTDKVHPKEQSYEILIDPAYKGRTAIIDAFDETYQLAAILAHVEDPLHLKKSDYPKVEKMMRKLRNNARFIWTDPGQLEQALASGEIDIAWGWPNVYSDLRKQDVPVKFMLEPKEGLVTWECGFSIPKTADAPKQEIYDFIDALEAPQSGKALIESFGYGPSNAKALELVSQEKLESLGLAGNPEKTIENGNLMGPMPERQRQHLIQMWSQIKAGG